MSLHKTLYGKIVYQIFFFVFNIIFVILSSLNESFIWFSLISRSNIDFICGMLMEKQKISLETEVLPSPEILILQENKS